MLPSRIVTTERIYVESHSNTESETELTLLPSATASKSGAGNYFRVGTSDLITNSMSISYDYLFKLLLCGDSGVGKTSMLRRYFSDEMNDAYIATIGK